MRRRLSTKARGLPPPETRGFAWIGHRKTSAQRSAQTAAELVVTPNISGSRSEEHTSELQSLMRISYAVFCLKKKNIFVTNSTYSIFITFTTLYHTLLHPYHSLFLTVS